MTNSDSDGINVFLSPTERANLIEVIESITGKKVYPGISDRELFARYKKAANEPKVNNPSSSKGQKMIYHLAPEEIQQLIFANPEVAPALGLINPGSEELVDGPLNRHYLYRKGIDPDEYMFLTEEDERRVNPANDEDVYTRKFK